MKKVMKLVTLTVAAMIFALLPDSITLHALAAPANYYVRYDGESGEWRMQIGEWKDNLAGRALYYLNNGSDSIKDGDTLVVMSGAVRAPENAVLTVNARLGNLTVQNTSAVIVTNGIDECFVLGDSFTAINGDVTNAYVYNDAVCTFNNNVNSLRLISTKEDHPYASVTVAGTVAYESEANPDRIINEYYNFAAGKYVFDSQLGLKTDPAFFSTTGTVPSAQPAEPSAAAPAESASPAVGEYDDVPKTGDSNLIFLLFAASAICFAGRSAIKRAH